MKSVKKIFKISMLTVTFFSANTFAAVCQDFEGKVDKNKGIDYATVTSVNDPLLSPENYTLPSLGKQNGANLIRMRLCRETVPSFSASLFRTYLDGKIQELWNGWRKGGYQDPTLWDALGNGYINFSIASGYRHEQVQKYLLNEMVQPSFQASMLQFLAKARPHLAHVQVYDVSSELIANDLLVLWDEKSGEVFTIFLEYVHA